MIKKGIIKNNSDSHSAQIGLYILRIGFVLFVREYWKYKSFVIFPTITIDFVKGKDQYIDFEFKFLCFGFGFRLILLNKY